MKSHREGAKTASDACVRQNSESGAFLAEVQIVSNPLILDIGETPVRM